METTGSSVVLANSQWRELSGLRLLPTFHVAVTKFKGGGAVAVSEAAFPPPSSVGSTPAVESSGGLPSVHSERNWAMRSSELLRRCAPFRSVFFPSPVWHKRQQ
nr:hypothetical protein Itr_chr11CG16590 [Ipomoea trifida]